MRKLLMVAMTAVAALAFSASAASAQTVEVENETTGLHCSNFTMVGHDPVGASCTVQAVSVGTANLYQHTGVSEVLFSQCNNNFEAAFNEAGAGFIYNQVLTPEAGACGREPCDEAAPSHENLAWPAQLSEGPNGLQLEVTFCLRAHTFNDSLEGTAGTPCHVIVDVATDAGHGFAVSTNGQRPCRNLPIELEGNWVTQQTPAHPNNMEVTHLVD